jgi:primosomal protein N' (replication factor Y)
MDVLDSSPHQGLKEAVPWEGDLSIAEPAASFYRWVARYTLSAPGDPWRAALPKGTIPPQRQEEGRYRLGNTTVERLTPQRQKVLMFAQKEAHTAARLAKKAQVSPGVVKGLIEAGALVPASTQRENDTLPLARLATLSDAQQKAAKALQAAQEFRPFLLDGVTGSGKTEVYFDVIASLLGQDSQAQVLVLVPEIALTPQWLSRFEERFGFRPVVWHTHVQGKTRHAAWWQVVRGQARVVVGARSALFLPFRNLRFIVVDEEHDGAYKQDEQFRYHGRDMAVALARHWRCPIVLASATPSLETFHNAQTGKYTRLSLPVRHQAASMPCVVLVDLKKQGGEKNAFLSDPLRTALAQIVTQGEQALLFLNRRGNAPVLLCTACGYRRDCPACDATLTVHGDKLLCHHCGFTEPWPLACPACNEEDTWRMYGPGTRRLMTEVQAFLPAARVAVADSDAAATPAEHKALMADILAGRVDVVIGTQMMAKGHHIPRLTLVGVVDGDMGLTHGDLRAAEKTFQLLTQVGGRAGREQAGQVMIQTYQPRHPLFQALKDYDRDAFYAREMQARQDWGDPPFGRLVGIILSGRQEAQVRQAAQQLARQAPTQAEVTVLGPAPAPLARLRNRYRYRLLVRGKQPLQGYVKTWVEAVKIPAAVQVVVDVDPQNFS